MGWTGGGGTGLTWDTAIGGWTIEDDFNGSFRGSEDRY